MFKVLGAGRRLRKEHPKEAPKHISHVAKLVTLQVVAVDVEQLVSCVVELVEPRLLAIASRLLVHARDASSPHHST